MKPESRMLTSPLSTGKIKEVVRAVRIERTLLSEPDFEAGCV
jgi:hypothetical protein